MPMPNEIRDTAATLIEERGAVNAREWAIHCATRSRDNFWLKVRLEIERQTANADNQLKHFRG
jgi:hypothetical protein